jgi:hypothetical protein
MRWSCRPLKTTGALLPPPFSASSGAGLCACTALGRCACLTLRRACQCTRHTARALTHLLLHSQPHTCNTGVTAAAAAGSSRLAGASRNSGEPRRALYPGRLALLPQQTRVCLIQSHHRIQVSAAATLKTSAAACASDLRSRHRARHLRHVTDPPTDSRRWHPLMPCHATLHSEGCDPRQVLRCISAREAQLVEPAAGLHVRLRLAGAGFPPVLVYKLFTHRPVTGALLAAAPLHPRCHCRAGADCLPAATCCTCRHLCVWAPGLCSRGGGQASSRGGGQASSSHGG